MRKFKSIALLTMFLGLSSGLTWPAVAADKINISKLKKGDKVELHWAGNWETVEFIEKLSPQMVRVQRANQPLPMAAPVDWLRPPAKSVKAARPRAADDPFATPDEKASAGRRTWTARTGKFSVDARLVRVDGDNVVLLRDDNREVTVPLARLVDADAQYVADFQAGRIKQEPAADEAGADADQGKAVESDEPEIAITPTDLDSARQVEVSPDTAWTYMPRAAAAEEVVKPGRLVLHPFVDIFESTRRILFVPREKKAFVVSLHAPPASHGQATSRIQECDLGGKEVSAAGVFGVNVAPIAISPDASQLVARTEAFGFGKQAELRLYSRDGNKAKAVAAWLPYNHHRAAGAAAGKPEPADSDRPELDHNADVTWVEYLDSNHLLTVNQRGELALWALPKLEPLYVLQGDIGYVKPALNRARDHLACPTKEGVAIVTALDGKGAGFLPADMTGFSIHAVAWTPDGTQLALVQPGRVRVWDLTTQKLTRDFASAHDNVVQCCAFSDNAHLVINGRIVMDVERRIPVAVVSNHDTDWPIRDGVQWSVDPRPTGGRPELIGALIPSKQFTDPAAGQSADDLLVIRPGLEVALELPTGDSPEHAQARAEIVAKLEHNGIKIVPQSKVRLVGTMSPGKTKTMRYMTFRRDQSGDYSITEQNLTLSYVVDGETIWKREMHITPPPILHLKEGQTIGDALAQSTKPDVRPLGRAWIPAYIARVPAEINARLGRDPAR